MIIVSGYKVFSREVEDKLYDHPAVELCALVGVPNPERPGSELVKAFIQLAPDYREKDPEQLKEEIKSLKKKNKDLSEKLTLSEAKSTQTIKKDEAISFETNSKLTSTDLQWDEEGNWAEMP